MKDKTLSILIAIVCLAGGVYGINLGMDEQSNRLWSSMSMEANQLWNSLFGPDYIVKDSGVRAGSYGYYWLDNHRVIFIGTHDPKPESAEEGRAHPGNTQLLIWNTETDKVHTYKENIPVPNLCYANDRVRYRLSQVVQERNDVKVQITTYMAGPLENPTKHELVFSLSNSDAYFRKWDINQFTCRRVKRPSTVADGQVWMMLKPNHGYLTFVKLTYDHEEYIYHLAGTQKSIVLPFDSRDIWIGGVHWYGSQGGYFWHGHAINGEELAHWRQSDCLRGWWLYPNGNTESVCIPSGIWVEYGADFIVPIKNGYVFGVTTIPSGRGIYVWRNGESARVVDDIIEQPVVSPNGCRVAFAHAPNFDAVRLGGKGHRSLMMVNLCVED